MANRPQKQKRRKQIAEEAKRQIRDPDTPFAYPLLRNVEVPEVALWVPRVDPRMPRLPEEVLRKWHLHSESLSLEIRVPTGLAVPFSWIGAKTKSGRREGDGKKTSRQFATNVNTLYDIFTTFCDIYDNFRLFVPLTSNAKNRHKSS